MPTETCDLPVDPKARGASAATRTRDASDAFTREAIAKKTGRAGQEASAVNLAEERYALVVASSKAIQWQELRHHLIAHIAGVAFPLRTPRKLMR